MERIERIEMQHVTRRYGAATALNDFNLTITGGQFVTLLGPSGCGKSTALNCLAGLLDLSEGEILVNGRPVQHIPSQKRGFGMVFQNYALFPHLNVNRNVGYGLEIRGVSKAERERRVARALERVHLEEFGKRYPAQLSGGQQQRLAIARTIVLEPGLLLLDEPLSNLDTKLRGEMRIEIKRLHEQLGLTTLYVTHDQSEAMSMSDIVVVMRAGRIEQLGTPQQIFKQPASLYVADFMGYSNRLPVTVMEWSEAETVVQTDDGLILHATSTQADWKVGQRGQVCFRPDDGRVVESASVNEVRGRVQLVEYLGNSFEALVQLPVSGLQFLITSQQPPEINSWIDFTVRPNRLLLFPLDQNNLTWADTHSAELEVAAKGKS